MGYDRSCIRRFLSVDVPHLLWVKFDVNPSGYPSPFFMFSAGDFGSGIINPFLTSSAVRFLTLSRSSSADLWLPLLYICFNHFSF